MENRDAVWPERLKYLRKSNNLSQTDVAGVLHCSQAAYGMYELGKRKISADSFWPWPSTIMCLWTISWDCVTKFDRSIKGTVRKFQFLHSLFYFC